MANTIIETPKMLVMQAQLGEWDNLNHLLVCKSTGEAAIIDPFFSKYWIDVCSDHGWTLSQVWLTHSHWDHSKGVKGLADREVWVHELEAERGWDGPSNREWKNRESTPQIQRIGNLEIEVHHTPGHTPGHTFLHRRFFVRGFCLWPYTHTSHTGRQGRAIGSLDI